jgi:hypothetical protein
MLAYPTPTFDASTILQAPGHRPIGRGACLEYEPQPEAVTPLNLVNKNTKNGMVGTRAKKFIQNNQFNTDMKHYDPTKGSPLSKPGSVGNVADQAISIPPKYAEPENGELRAILAILNGKPASSEDVGKLSARAVQSLGTKSKKLSRMDGAVQVARDFADAREITRKNEAVRKAVSQGFTPDEAAAAYKRMREKEAESALRRDEDESSRLADLIDSKISGTQNGSIRGNDETGLFLAKAANAVLVKKAQSINEKLDRMVKFDETPKVFSPGRQFAMKTSLEGIKEKHKGRPADKDIAERYGLTIDEIKEGRRLSKGFSRISKL